jgi:hypothetical protein
MATVEETSDAANDATASLTQRARRYLIIVVVLIVFGCGWIGQQVAFPLMPGLGRIARQLPDSVQMFCILALLALSIIGTCYFFYEWARERLRRRSACTPIEFCIDDPRFNESTVSKE